MMRRDKFYKILRQNCNGKWGNGHKFHVEISAKQGWPFPSVRKGSMGYQLMVLGKPADNLGKIKLCSVYQNKFRI